MSDVVPEFQPCEVAAKTIRARAADWVIAKRESEDWSQSKQLELDAWLAESPAHTVSYLRIDSAWSQGDRLSALRAPEARQFLQRFRPIFIRVSAVIAAIVIIAIAARDIWQTGVGEKTYETAIGGHASVTLADGSRIELNTDTRVRVSDAENKREVWLDKGEVYFDVRHDFSHPFVVMVAGHRVTDIGTKFLVRRDPSRVRISLMEGSVRFETGGSSPRELATLMPGDIAVATSDSVSVTKEPTQDLKNALSWRNGLLVFRHTTLADAAAEFNRYSAMKLVITDENVARLQIGGTFQATDPERFARAAQNMLGLRIENLGSETVISR